MSSLSLSRLLAAAALAHAMDPKFEQAFKLMQRRDKVRCKVENFEDCGEREIAYIQGHEGEPEGPVITYIRDLFVRWGFAEWHAPGTSDKDLMIEMQKLARHDTRKIEDDDVAVWHDQRMAILEQLLNIRYKRRNAHDEL